MKKIIIVGGVAGGATAAARLRRLDEESQIVLFERGEYVSFANCGLPYYIGETIKDRSKLLVQTVEGMSKKFNLDIRNLTEVTKIDRENKTVTVKNVQTGETYEESYDALILSPGAKPIFPPIPGIKEADNIFTLRNIPDTDKIKAYVDERKPNEAVVIGGGFIGLEMAENLVDRGVNVTLVEMAKQVMAPLDYEMAAIVHRHLKDKGVNLILEDGVKAFEDNGNKIVLSSGKEITTDMTMLSIGVKPENSLAAEVGLELGDRGGIKVNEYLQTNDPAIFALGDAIEVTDYINGQPTMIPLAGPANRQGRIVANNVYGKQEAYKGTLGTGIAKVFDLTVATTGNNEKVLSQKGIEYRVAHVHPASHAGYYPGAAPIALKLIFDGETGKIFGAQAVAADGADKRIDVIATAIKGNLTVHDLTEIELSYAPPFSSAKDPVNMVGYVASNMIDEGIETAQWHEIDQVIEDGGMLIDVREPVEREAGFIKGSVNIPLGEIRDRLDEIPKDETIYITCQVGLRGYLATRILTANGYKVKNLDGGWKTYSAVFHNGDEQAEEEAATIESNQQLDVTGLQCPGPLMNVFKTMKTFEKGDILKVLATDPNFINDIKGWCASNGNTVLKIEQDDKTYVTYIRKDA
ncbi:CoA-disulfide reductase [Aquibacillus sediminis]|uniref:CoA-disulfide reductase n=1 Tax=Aquibacillus sediminis TaxID=2574734 RepID=UPI0011089F2B|nr:CoA-disulfide reductase [Aquibacillus sediminis]